jgi:hypothetical protein
MARDLSPAWELLSVVTRARLQLATARPLIWEKARLPTAERTQIVNSTAGGTDQVLMRVALETHLPDGRLVTSCLDIVASPRRWRAQPYITLNNGTDWLVWEGAATERDDAAAFAQSVDAAARSLLSETMSIDFEALVKGPEAEPAPEEAAPAPDEAQPAPEEAAASAGEASGSAAPAENAAENAATATAAGSSAGADEIPVIADPPTAVPISGDEPSAVPVSAEEAATSPAVRRHQ